MFNHFRISDVTISFRFDFQLVQFMIMMFSFSSVYFWNSLVFVVLYPRSVSVSPSHRAIYINKTYNILNLKIVFTICSRLNRKAFVLCINTLSSEVSSVFFCKFCLVFSGWFIVPKAIHKSVVCCCWFIGIAFRIWPIQTPPQSQYKLPKSISSDSSP